MIMLSFDDSTEYLTLNVNIDQVGAAEMRASSIHVDDADRLRTRQIPGCRI